MPWTRFIALVGMLAAIALPFWNIPLILRISRRKSSQDMSLWWTFGVWGCLVLMLPSGLASPDPIFRVFAIMNVALFSIVVAQILRYRRPVRAGWQGRQSATLLDPADGA